MSDNWAEDDHEREIATRQLRNILGYGRSEIAMAHALCNGPDGEDWHQAQLRAPEALDTIEEWGCVVISRSLMDELERQAAGGE